MFFENVIEFIVKTDVFELPPCLSSMWAVTVPWVQDAIRIGAAFIRSRSGTIERQCYGSLLHSPGQQAASSRFGKVFFFIAKTNVLGKVCIIHGKKWGF